MASSDRANKILQGVALWCSYYRSNPARFVKDYLHIDLKIFQKIIITMMMKSTVFAMIAARGIGKTFISAIYAVIRCILYPGTKVCIASGVRSQGISILEKVLLELKPRSPELAAEIDDSQTRINGTNAQIVFRNGSYMKVCTASDSSRGNRANVLILDECRLIDLDVVDTVLRKFLTQRRMPLYTELTDAQRKIEYQKEKNITIYLTSAFFQDSWVYQKCKDVCGKMIDDSKRQFVCGLPYHLSLYEGLLDRELIEDEMSDTNFSEIKFDMEYGALFYGSAEGAFFEYDSIAKNRKLKYPMLPDRLSAKVGGQSLSIQPKQNGELRILSADIALMSSKKHNNDATSIFVNQMLPTKAGRYIYNIVYSDEMEGMHTETQALAIRKLYDEYMCDYIVLDTNGKSMPTYIVIYRLQREIKRGR